MLLDVLTLIVVIAFIIGVASNSKLILSNQSYINNIFFFTSVLYFYISHYYFSDVLSLLREDRLEYEESRHVSEDKRERTFSRFTTALARRAHGFVVEIVLLIYFIFIIFFVIVKTETLKGTVTLSNLFSRSGEDIVRFLQTFLISYIFSYITFYLVRNIFYVKTFTNVVLSLVNIVLFFIIIGTAYRYIYNNFYKIVGKTSENVEFVSKVNVFIGIIESFIFYIPCLIDDIFTALTQTKNNTSRKMFIIFFIQLIVLFYYFALPTIERSVSNYLGNTILYEPLNLDSNYNDNDIILNKTRLKEIIKSQEYNNNNNATSLDENYGISFWLYIDSQQGLKDKDYTILNFSNKPHITFNTFSKTLKVSFDSSTLNVKDIQLQKWNHIVVNYVSGTVDVVVNNELVETSENIILPIGIDNVYVGAINGIPGRITNVAYFSEPLGSGLISHIYKTNSTQSIPKTAGILGNSLFLISKLAKDATSVVREADGVVQSAFDIDNHVSNVKRLPRRAYNALTNTKENLREYYQYFVDYYIFDYEYKFKNSLKESDILADERIDIEKNIADLNETINRITIEKASKNVKMVSNGDKSEEIYRVNKKYEKDINNYRDDIERLKQKLILNSEKQKKVEII